jgi:hypothetical protein
VCKCELCSLPDALSDALDTKISIAKDASEFVGQFCRRREGDPFAAIQLFDTYMSIIIQERLFFDYKQFLLPLRFFGMFDKPDLLQQVGEAVHRVFQRHLGTGVDYGAGVETLSLYLESVLHPMHDIPMLQDSADAHRLDARLKEAASSIVSYLDSIP